MKKIGLLLVVALVSGHSLFAQRVDVFSVMGGYSSVSYTIGEGNDSYTEQFSGITLGVSGFTGQVFGLYSSSSFIFVSQIEATLVADGSSQSVTIDDMSVYDSVFAMDSQLGLARRAPVADDLYLTVGGGLNYSQVTLSATDADGFFSSFMFGIAGVGGMVDISYTLTENLWLNAMLRAGYNFFTVFGDIDDLPGSFQRGVSFSPGVGVGISF